MATVASGSKFSVTDGNRHDLSSKCFNTHGPYQSVQLRTAEYIRILPTQVAAMSFQALPEPWAIALGSINSFSDDEIIHRFGRSYPDVDGKMIPELGGPIEIEAPPLRVPEPASSVGDLNRLPVETLCMILLGLDLHSLCRFTQVSRRARDLARSLPEYRQLTRPVPSVLRALVRTGMVGVHSLGDIYKQFNSTTCTSCGDTGGFLFLPTCDRCCNMCLNNNKDLWALSLKEAKHLFKLSPEDLSKMPRLLSLRGIYLWERTKRLNLVSFRDARYAAGHQHQPPWRLPTDDFKTRRSQNWGMASMPFPHLGSDGCLGRAYWCELCSRLRLAQTSALHRHYLVPLGTLRLSGTSMAELGRLYDGECLDWTREAFVQHVRSCEKNRYFMPMT